MRCEQDIIYVVDPDEAVHDALSTLLSAIDTRVVCYPSAEAFLDSNSAHSLRSGCLLVEANLPGMGSLALLRRLRAQGVDLPILVLTSTSNGEIAKQALKAGAVEVIAKPLVGGRLLSQLRHLELRNDGACAEPKG